MRKEKKLPLGRLVLTLALIVVVDFISLRVYVPELIDLTYLEESTNWPTTEGVITESRVMHGDDDYGGDEPVVRYEYDVDGRRYSSFRVGLGPGDTEFSDVPRYFVGKRVTVYYEPNNPQRAILDPGRRPSTFSILCAGVAGIAFVAVHLLYRSYFIEAVRRAVGKVRDWRARI